MSLNIYKILPAHSDLSLSKEEFEIALHNASYGFRGPTLVKAIQDNVATIPYIAGEHQSYRVEEVLLMYGETCAAMTARWRVVENGLVAKATKEAVLFVEAGPDDVPGGIIRIYEFVGDFPK